MLINVGLGFVVVAWLYQLYVSIKKKRTLEPLFIILYSVGVLFLAINNFNIGENLAGILNVVALASALGAGLASNSKRSRK